MNASVDKNIICPHRFTVSDLAEILGVHPSTIRKGRERRTIGTSLAKRLEKVTGIDRRLFVWPDDFGDPWPLVLKNGAPNN